ncbi:MAG TPA: VOC family protein [Minicystis sp.]|nr:VOC family protein [Minicystis sp.]
MANPNDGRFTWHEIMTADPAAAAKFYAALLGWSVQEVPMGAMGTYRLFQLGGKNVGGAMSGPPDVPPHWLTYVGASDPDATVKKIAELGGKVIVPPTDVPGMVRFAVAMDPQGAAFGVLKGLGPDAEEPPPEGPPGPGMFCWDELYTKDKKAAASFYGAIFGWTGKVAPEDPMQYWHWLNAGKDVGGMMSLDMIPTPGVPPHWLSYIAVADADASTKKAKDLGAKVLMDVMDIPKVGKFSVLADPTGAAFALFRTAHV